MRDSLHLAAGKVEKVHSISLNYNTEMDKAAGLPNKKKLQEKLMKKKDADMSKLLTKAQYQKYYRREKTIRRTESIEYKGRQPY